MATAPQSQTDTRNPRSMETSDGSHRPPGSADVGGIPANLEHGLQDDGVGGTPATTEPMDADWPAQEAAAKGDVGDRDPETVEPKPTAERREPGHIDSALESLGEAISAPVREGSEEMSEDVSSEPGKPRR
jgi:hypothetical protein